MAAKKARYYKIRLTGTNVNEDLLVTEYEIVPYPASTYHKFTFADGRVIWKNDFGVSTVLVLPVDMSSEEYLAEFSQMAGLPR